MPNNPNVTVQGSDYDFVNILLDGKSILEITKDGIYITRDAGDYEVTVSKYFNGEIKQGLLNPKTILERD